MPDFPRSILVTCAGGAQGSAIVQACRAAGATMRVLLRKGSPDPFGDGVNIVRGDLADAERVGLACLAVDAVALTLPLNAGPEDILRYGRNMVDAALEAEVKLLVFNTSGHVSRHSGTGLMEAKVELIDYMKASGLPSIILKPTLYMSNVAAPWSAPAIMHQGVFAYPLPADFQTSWISWEDMAAYVVAAMRRPELAGASFDIGGPEALTGPEMANILSGIVDREVGYYPVPLANFAAGLSAVIGKDAADQVAANYAWVHRQRPTLLAVDPSDTLSMLPITPTPFADWAKARDWPALAGTERAA
ncbi:NmrA family NAD(P)-binding protein [Mesorhizobium sp. STM 4661]|uniref:SDR family oxidoreductase n=1 Tax=Mesorhizobium sp. STM 4661 TaxID=1297570 RepID=UPI0002BFF018|nr:NmrA family NAD(P)-binding protein [Mesorhizobium sp. STM 4661]CCV11874.1 putative Nucleoside-diphosphate-sugar epimerase [Mesorhizobium sp. STM 4661]